MLWFPLFRSALQYSQNVVDRGPVTWILLPTRCRHLPQFLGVAPGRGEDWCLRSHAFKNTKDRHIIVVRGKWDTVRQDLRGHLNVPAGFVSREAHFVDGHPHRIHVCLFGRTTPLGLKPVRIQQFRRTPTPGVGTTGRRRLRCGGRNHIAGDPREPNIRKTSATIVGYEDICL